MTNVQVEVKEISYGKYHGYVRTIDMDEKGVYVAGIDLAEILGYKDPKGQIKNLVRSSFKQIVNIPLFKKKHGGWFIHHGIRLF